MPRPNEWSILAVAAVLVQICGGLSYSFSVYSEELKLIYVRQEDVDLLGTAKVRESPPTIPPTLYLGRASRRNVT